MSDDPKMPDLGNLMDVAKKLYAKYVKFYKKMNRYDEEPPVPAP